MTKKRVYYICSLFILLLPIIFYWFSLLHINDTQFLLILPPNFLNFFIADNSFFVMSRLVNLIGIWDNSIISYITVGVDCYIWFSVLFAISDLFTFITDIIYTWRKK